MKRKLINQSEACELVGISRTGFRNWNLKPVKRKGRYVFYDAAEVQRAARDRQASAGRHARPGSHDIEAGQAFIEFMTKDLMSEIARDAAYLIANALREWELSAARIAEIAGLVLLLPSIASERHALSGSLDIAYANSARDFITAVKAQEPLPKTFPMMTEENPFAEWLLENDHAAGSEIIAPPPSSGSTEDLFDG